MYRVQHTYRIIYNQTTSHNPEGWYNVAYVWALDGEDAKRVFYKNYNNVNSDGSWSSINYKILEVDEFHEIGEIKS